MFLRGRLPNDIQRHPSRGRHHRNTLFDDPRLMPGNPLQGSAAAIGVLQRHIGDDRQIGKDDIRRIQ